MAKIPTALLEAFRVAADRDVEAIAVLLIDDGFDAEIMRVLVAWSQVEHRWDGPRSPAPDNGLATAAAWRWLISGLIVDYDELARAAGVTRMVARAKLAMLLANKLAFPDGTISKVAHGALQQHAKRALGIKPPKQEPKPQEKPKDDRGTN